MYFETWWQENVDRIKALTGLEDLSLIKPAFENCWLVALNHGAPR